MECSLNAHIRFCGEYRFCKHKTIWALTDGPGCDMITMLGRIFPALFSFPAGALDKKRRTRTQARPHVFNSTADNCHPTTVWLRALPGKEMTPDYCRGSFLFLGFDHWITSLSAGSTGLFMFGWNPFRSIHVLQLSYASGIYVKRKMWNAQPAGVITIFGITFFRTISLP